MRVQGRTPRALHFVIPPSAGNMAGIERVTLHCAIGLSEVWPDTSITVHMFGDYKIPEELSDARIIRHPDCSILLLGLGLRPWFRKAGAGAQWVVAQPMTALSIALWNPLFAMRTRLMVVLHGALHIEMAGLRRRAQYRLFGQLARRCQWRVAAVSRALARHAEQVLKLPHASIVTLYNPSFTVAPLRAKRARTATFRCLALGRLHPQKGFDVLIPAFHASDVGEEAELVIFGEGPQRALLEEAVNTGPRAAQITLCGYTENALAELGRADLFVMPSRYEGLAGTLVEALAVGTPVLAVDHPYGAREILADGRYGRLLPPLEERKLAQGITDEYRRWRQDLPPTAGPAPDSRHILQFRRDIAVRKYARVLSRMLIAEPAR
jgi:glycosyltransferase involved in cell wall biosynthesis